LIDSPFGPRPRPTSGYQFHEGIDNPAPEGTPVFAGAAGTVRVLTDDNGCRIEVANDTVVPPCITPIFGHGGRIVALAHGNELYTLYFHLSRQADGLATGSRVFAGDRIGGVGQTGNASYPHVHFEVRDGSFFQRDSPAKNPLGYVSGTRLDPVITGLSLTPVGDGTGEVAVTVEKTGDDPSLNEVRLITRDASGAVVSDRRVRFNERESINGNQAEFFLEDGSSILLEPTCLHEPFCTPPDPAPAPVYNLTVRFKGFIVPSQGSYEALAVDVVGRTGQRMLLIN
jgi:murein DD-endopeptidase MepM/ murein hydrolase activator NlpD